MIHNTKKHSRSEDDNTVWTRSGTKDNRTVTKRWKYAIGCSNGLEEVDSGPKNNRTLTKRWVVVLRMIEHPQRGG